MSRAFVKEEDPDAPVVLADRPISAHPNYMTPAGFKDMELQITALEAEFAGLNSDKDLTRRTRRAGDPARSALLSCSA